MNILKEATFNTVGELKEALKDIDDNIKIESYKQCFEDMFICQYDIPCDVLLLQFDDVVEFYFTTKNDCYGKI